MPASPTRQLLEKLIAIPSVNPDGDPGTPHTGEKEIVAFLSGELRKAGATVKTRNVQPGRPNLLARFPLRGKPKTRILFAPHSDTVSVTGMTVEPFKPVVRQGKLFGRGACDTKGPMAAMITALAETTRQPEYRQGETEFHFAAFMGEETGCVGARAFADSGEARPYQLAIIAEPTDFKIVHAHKGCLWARIDIPGRAAHASISHPEDNAIFKAARVLTALQKDFLPWLEGFSHPFLGKTTLSPGIIEGGSKANIAPERCSITIDIRTIPNLPSSKIKSRLEALLKKTAPGATVSVPTIGGSLNTDHRHPLIQAILPATRGLDAAPWFCDAAALAAVGVPAIACGPGSIRQAHTKDEFIRLKDLDDGHRRYVRMMRLLLD